MRILFVSATIFEIQPLLDHYKMIPDNSADVYVGRVNESELNVQISGVGMVATAFCMGSLVNERFDLVINAGICGSFNDFLPIGSVVNVHFDQLIEMGAEEASGNVLSMEEMGLAGKTRFENSTLLPGSKVLEALPKVNGITVNTVHGSDDSIRRVVELFHPMVESMEGAAAFYAAQEAGFPFVQIRAVSNKVEPRNKNRWNIPLAIDRLNSTLIQLTEELV